VLKEVIITAQKRPERIEDIPVAAQMVSSPALAAANVADLSDLNNLVPSVQLNGTINGRVPTAVRVTSGSMACASAPSCWAAHWLSGAHRIPAQRSSSAFRRPALTPYLRGVPGSLGGFQERTAGESYEWRVKFWLGYQWAGDNVE